MQRTGIVAESALWSGGSPLAFDGRVFSERGRLETLFSIGRRAVGILREHCHRVAPDGRALFVGQLPGWVEGARLRAFMDEVESEHPICPEAPFEGTERIAGAAWLAAEHLREAADDGVAKLCFAPGTDDLPLHTHEQSERFIFCLAGRGRFHYSHETLRAFGGSDVRYADIRAGSFVLFSRDVLHTFSASERGMVLVSYQSPSVPFDDPDQYTLPLVNWSPWMEPVDDVSWRRGTGQTWKSEDIAWMCA